MFFRPHIEVIRQNVLKANTHIGKTQVLWSDIKILTVWTGKNEWKPIKTSIRTFQMNYRLKNQSKFMPKSTQGEKRVKPQERKFVVHHFKRIRSHFFVHFHVVYTHILHISHEKTPLESKSLKNALKTISDKSSSPRLWTNSISNAKLFKWKWSINLL